MKRSARPLNSPRAKKVNEAVSTMAVYVAKSRAFLKKLMEDMGQIRWRTVGAAIIMDNPNELITRMTQEYDEGVVEDLEWVMDHMNILEQTKILPSMSAYMNEFVRWLESMMFALFQCRWPVVGQTSGGDPVFMPKKPDRFDETARTYITVATPLLDKMEALLQDPYVAEAEETPVEGARCVVCLTRAPSIAVVPCGHMCLCDRCNVEITACPLCRRDVDSTLAIFLP